MVIEPRGLWEHNAYQTDNRLVVEVKPLKEDPNKLFQTTRAGYKGERLSLNFQNVDVRSLLQVIADFTNLNIITSDSVSGNLTLRLKDVPWDQALDIILQAKGLDMRKNGNVILVAPKDELATKEKLDLEARSQIADLEPLRSETFQLNYQKAQDLVDFLNGTGASGGTSSVGGTANRILSKRGAASADLRTNQVFVVETGTKLEQIRGVIAKLDISEPAGHHRVAHRRSQRPVQSQPRRQARLQQCGERRSRTDRPGELPDHRQLSRASASRPGRRRRPAPVSSPTRSSSACRRRGSTVSIRCRSVSVSSTRRPPSS